MVKNLPANAGHAGLIPDWEDSLEKGIFSALHLLQCSCLENSMDRGAWRAFGPQDHKESNTSQLLSM